MAASTFTTFRDVCDYIAHQLAEQCDDPKSMSCAERAANIREWIFDHATDTVPAAALNCECPHTAENLANLYHAQLHNDEEEAPKTKAGKTQTKAEVAASKVTALKHAHPDVPTSEIAVQSIVGLLNATADAACHADIIKTLSEASRNEQSEERQRHTAQCLQSINSAFSRVVSVTVTPSKEDPLERPVFQCNDLQVVFYLDMGDAPEKFDLYQAEQVISDPSEASGLLLSTRKGNPGYLTCQEPPKKHASLLFVSLWVGKKEPGAFIGTAYGTNHTKTVPVKNALHQLMFQPPKDEAGAEKLITQLEVWSQAKDVFALFGEVPSTLC